MGLVKILSLTGDYLKDSSGDYIWIWDDEDDITTPTSEIDDGDICTPSSSPVDRQ